MPHPEKNSGTVASDKVHEWELGKVYSISFHPAGEKIWIARCRELSVELSLQEPREIIEAAELTGWLPRTAGHFGDGCDITHEFASEAYEVLEKHAGREFPLPMVCEFTDRLWEVWLAGRVD
jgi:hypothetical protein